MNEKINLIEILKDCPKGTKLYSPLVGEVEFKGINYDCEAYPIDVLYGLTGLYFTKEGLYYADGKDGECMLFPSRDQRDWGKFKLEKPNKTKFDPKTLQPFDKVLVRDECYERWRCEFYSYLHNNGGYPYITINDAYKHCIPYNDETKHLVGTRAEAPEFYRYWED